MNSIAAPVRQRQTNFEESVDLSFSTSRIAAYSELAKAKIGLMVLFTVAVGYTLAGHGTWELVPFLHASVGVLLAVISSSSLNQYIERFTDAKMERTQNRPLPSGRLSGFEVLLIGLLTSVVSFVYLYTTVNPLTAWLTLLTTVMYAGMYTPLKRYTAFCTVVGAVPGAMPPVLGWAATGTPLSLTTLSLFAIIFVWQFPHFLAIAWMYHGQYKNADLKMLPADGRSKVVGSIALAYAVVLIPVSLLPMHFGYAGDLYGLFAVLLGTYYAYYSLMFFKDETRTTARRLLMASFVYLPSVLLVLTIDHLRLLN